MTNRHPPRPNASLTRAVRVRLFASLVALAAGAAAVVVAILLVRTALS